MRGREGKGREERERVCVCVCLMDDGWLFVYWEEKRKMKEPRRTESADDKGNHEPSPCSRELVDVEECG